MTRKTIKALLIPAIVIASIAAVAGTVAAHNATATPSCTGLSYSATNYDKTVTNSIVVKVDGTVVHADPDFKASDTGSTPWSPLAPHTWSVVIDAPSTQYDRQFSGVWQACQTAPTTTVVVATTVAATTTTVPASTTDPVTTTLPPCQEDEPCWDCTTMGNQICGPTTTVVAVDIPPVPTTVALDVVSLTPAEPVLPATGANDGVLVLAVFLVLAGFVFLAIRGRRVQ